MKEKCVIGGWVLWHCRMNFQLSTLLRKYVGYLGRCVLVDVITYMIDRCLGPIDTHVGSPVSKERASRVSYAERFGVLLSMTWFTYGLRETQEFMERSKQRKSKWRDEKGCQVLDDVQRKLLQLYPNLYRVICSNWSVPHYIIHDFCL